MDDTGDGPHVRVDVRRSGGLAGVTRKGTAQLTGDEARRLTETMGAAAAASASGTPDAFHYHVRVGDREWTVGEHALPVEVRARLQSILAAS